MACPKAIRLPSGASTSSSRWPYSLSAEPCTSPLGKVSSFQVLDMHERPDLDEVVHGASAVDWVDMRIATIGVAGTPLNQGFNDFYQAFGKDFVVVSIFAPLVRRFHKSPAAAHGFAFRRQGDMR